MNHLLKSLLISTWATFIALSPINASAETIKKLIVTYELEVSPENEPLIPVIASMEGWKSESGITSEEFINERVSKPRVNMVFDRLIEQAVKSYFGIAGKTQADAVLLQYQGAHKVTSEFVSVESE